MKEQRDKYKYFFSFRTFTVLIFILAISLSGVSIYNTQSIIKRADRNDAQMLEVFRLLRADAEFKTVRDSSGRYYIDSIKVAKPETARIIEDALITQATEQLKEFPRMMIDESSSGREVLVLWATLLTLLSIIFTFLGFIELKERLGSVDEKMEEINTALTKVQHLEKKVEEDSLLSAYNLQVQVALIKPKEEEKIKKLEELIRRIKVDKGIHNERKNTLISDCLFYIGNSYYKLKRYNEAVTYYQNTNKLWPNDAYVVLNLGQAYAHLNNLTQAKIYFEEAISLDLGNNEGVKEKAEELLAKIEEEEAKYRKRKDTE